MICFNFLFNVSNSENNINQQQIKFENIPLFTIENSKIVIELGTLNEKVSIIRLTSDTLHVLSCFHDVHVCHKIRASRVNRMTKLYCEYCHCYTST